MALVERLWASPGRFWGVRNRKAVPVRLEQWTVTVGGYFLGQFEVGCAHQNRGARQPVLRQQPVRIRAPVGFEDEHAGRFRLQRAQQGKSGLADLGPGACALKRITG